MAAILNGEWAVRHNFERGPPKDYPAKFGLILLSSFSQFRGED